jgi:tetratricopeptide (TPR) repeat protein
MALALIGIFTLMIRKRHPMVFFGILWFFIWMIPASNITPLNHCMAERYLYIAMVGPAIIISYLSMRIFLPSASFYGAIEKSKQKASLTEDLVETRDIARRRLFLWSCFMLALVFLYTWRTINRNATWKDSYSFWGSLDKEQPMSARAHTFLGLYYRNQKDYPKALKEFNTALSISPEYAPAAGNIVDMYLEKRDFTKAKEYYDLAAKLDPGDKLLLNRHGRILLGTDQIDKAIEVLKESTLVNPFYMPAYNNLALAYFKKNDLENSIKWYDYALALDSKNSELWVNKGIALFSNKEIFAARSAFESAIAIDPDNLGAHNNLGVTYLRNGEFDLARKEFIFVLKNNPQHSEALRNLTDTENALRNSR